MSILHLQQKYCQNDLSHMQNEIKRIIKLKNQNSRYYLTR